MPSWSLFCARLSLGRASRPPFPLLGFARPFLLCFRTYSVNSTTALNTQNTHSRNHHRRGDSSAGFFPVWASRCLSARRSMRTFLEGRNETTRIETKTPKPTPTQPRRLCQHFSVNISMTANRRFRGARPDRTRVRPTSVSCPPPSLSLSESKA